VSIAIVGIDCATQSKKIGLARGYLGHSQPYVQEVTTGDHVESIVTTIAQWIRPQSPALIALDAPLGWPATLARELAKHEAGEPIQAKRDETFRRLTDRLVCEKTGKRPLDVGADRIARTAHAALALLRELRVCTGQTIPLAWAPNLGPQAYAIEVYPAATLQVRGLVASGYKGKERQRARQSLLGELRTHIEVPDSGMLERMLDNDDLLDAAVCVLAAADFLREECIQPTDMDLARKEGWIWVRRTGLIGK
jgi:predicted RNase H-like nuclease